MMSKEELAEAARRGRLLAIKRRQKSGEWAVPAKDKAAAEEAAQEDSNNKAKKNGGKDKEVTKEDTEEKVVVDPATLTKNQLRKLKKKQARLRTREAAEKETGSNKQEEQQ